MAVRLCRSRESPRSGRGSAIPLQRELLAFVLGRSGGPVRLLNAGFAAILLKNSVGALALARRQAIEPSLIVNQGLCKSRLTVFQVRVASTLGISHLLIRRRFCAVAASRNSSCAPVSPRSRSRSSFRIR